MDLREVDAVNPSSHWFFRYKIRAVLWALSRFQVRARTIVDVGAGEGFVGRGIQDGLPGSQLYCVDPEYSDEQLQRGDSQVHFTRTNPKIPARLYLMLDVLEHVEDDAALLSEYVEDAEVGATFAITVPAFMSLWSAHDVFLHHFRRYRLEELEELVEGAGLRLVYSRYLYAPLFPVAYILRRLRRNKPAKSDLKAVNSVVSALIMAVLQLELKLTKNRRFGTSAFVLAVKA